jgi:hypothetical protein
MEDKSIDWSADSSGFAVVDHPGIQPDEIINGLYLSNAYTEGCRDVLKKYSITHILQVGLPGHEVGPHYPEEFVYDNICLVDRSNADLVVHLPHALNFIERGREQGTFILLLRSPPHTKRYLPRRS